MQDEIVEEIHAHRAAISDRFHGNLEEIIRYYQSFTVAIPRSSILPQSRRMIDAE